MTCCAYCELDLPDSLVQCLICEKWFCNNIQNYRGSHIITHLVLSKHNKINLHPNSKIGGDSPIECYNCGNQNIFNLGFISAKQDNIIVLLCRLPCSQQKDLNWDTQNWQSLIEDRHLVNWLSNSIGESKIKINFNQINLLEKNWRINNKIKLSDLNDNKEDDNNDLQINPILLRYNDAYQYQNIFAPLIKIEADYDKSLKDSNSLNYISIDWSLSINNKYLAKFYFSNIDSLELKISIGDEMILRYNGPELNSNWESIGYIIKLPDAYQEQFTLELIPSKIKPPIHISNRFTLEFIWKGISYDRMQEALKNFAINENSTSNFIHNKLLGIEDDNSNLPINLNIPTNLNIPNMPLLNSSQLFAIKNALISPLTLIQGPPGTGKTITSATIIYHLNKLNPKNKLLVCAPSNVAVDHLTEKLIKIGLKVLRITAKSKEDIDSNIKKFTLHEQIKLNASKNFKKLIDLKEKFGELNLIDSKNFFNNLKKLEKKIISNSDIICCTCVGANDKRISNLKFSTILIDESTQATEPECLIPIVKGTKQLILIGDHQQLGPIILNKRANDAGLSQSLFERLILLGHKPIRLEVQYRMHPCLSEFPSNMFYNGSLQNGITNNDRILLNSSFPWPIKNLPMMFWATYGREELSNSGISFINRIEAINIEKIVTKLINDKINPNKIGIITPYEGQRNYILQYLQLNSTYGKEIYNQIEVVSVDAFQGREKDYIILSCVRANTLQQIGFLRDPRRLNVALTRARYGLIIVGNPKALAKDKLWNNLLTFYRSTGCLVEGSIDNLQLSSVQLSRPREFHHFSKNSIDSDNETVISTIQNDNFNQNISQLTQQFNNDLTF